MPFIYALYLLSGVLKAMFIFYGIRFPVDLTLLTAFILIIHIGLSFFLYGIKVQFKKNIIYSLILLTLFFLWILISLSYGNSPSYGYKKSLLFITNILAFAYPFLISEFKLSGFLKYLSVLTVILFLWFFYVYFILTAQLRGSEIYLKIMGLYLTMGILGGLIFLVFATSEKRIFSNWFLDTVIMILLFVFVVISGARGPILFMILSLFLYFIYRIIRIKLKTKINVNKLFKITFIGLPVLLGFIVIIFNKFYNKIILLAERSLFRMSLIFNKIDNVSEMGSSVDIRMKQYKFALNSIFSDVIHFFFGYGFGSFGIMYSHADVRLYPHNIFLEIWFETGIIGLLLFLSFLALVFFKQLSKRIYVSGFVILYMILNMMKSSSIVDIRIFFAFFALMIINSNIRKDIVNNEN
ncbi:MAG: hypothetical protein DRI94_02690 [Bacteroidetes bacterium]|nr:MAG: hypothetical protein DRI94_02690 [Bacteroidota bacterium]